MDVIEKIDNLLLRTTPSLSDDAISLLEIAYFTEEFERMDELFGFSDFKGKFKSMLDKAGLEIERERSILDVMKNASTAMAKVFYWAFKAGFSKKEEDKSKLKDEIQKSKIGPGDVIHFLMMVDFLTLHVFSIATHMIEVVTGWSIRPKIRKEPKTERIAELRIQNAVKELKDAATKISGSVRTRINTYINKLENIYNKLASMPVGV